MNKNIYIICRFVWMALLGIILTACSTDMAEVQPETKPEAEQEGEMRELEHITFTASLGESGTRVTYTQGYGALNRSWEASENLGVYIKKTDGSVVYAGSITSSGATTDVERTFEGDVTRLQSGESYVYVHPSFNDNDDDNDNETVGQAAHGTINYVAQNGAQNVAQDGALGSTAHLKPLIPMVWRNGAQVAEMQGYVVHMVLTFKEDPGTITSIALQTMDLGETTKTEDLVFPKQFKTAALGDAVNSSLAAPKTRGYQLTDAVKADYTNTITLKVSGTNTATQDNGVWKAEAYLACASVKNLDVFRSKYNVKVVANSGTFYSDYKSFPGQTTANANDGLNMLANGKMYKLSAKMSKNAVAPTIISDNFGVNSLLGMWNQYGKPSDPNGLIVLDESYWPSQLQQVVGPSGARTTVQDILRINATQGTPNFFGPQANSIYAINAAAYGDTKQENVTFNNIQITAPTEVYFTIVSEFAWNQNLVGYYHYPTANEGSVTSTNVKKTIIFPDVSKPYHEPFAKGETGHQDKNNVGTPAQAPIQEFETVKLLYTDANGYTSTTFPAGTTIGFWMMIDPEANAIEDPANTTGYAPRTYDLMNWRQWRLFTNSAWNAQNTTANGAATNWPSTGYPNSNFFASGDVCNGSGNPIQGLAIYGVKDNGTNNYNYAYGAMIFMVSTSVPSAMSTQNKAYFNIGSGALVIAKQ